MPSPALTPTPYGASSLKLTHAKKFTFTLDSDLVLACEDIAGSMGLTLDQYMQTAVNEALKLSMGL